MAKNRNITLIIDLSATPGRNLMRGIARYSSLFGPWQLNYFWTEFYGKSPMNSNVLTRLKKNLVNSDGIIMREPFAWGPLKKIDIPMIVASAIKDTELPEHPTIMTNSEAIGNKGAEYFINKGFKQLAFCGLEEMIWSEHRERYFCEKAKQAGLKIFNYSFKYPHTEKRRHSIMDRLAKWTQRLPKPIGIMSANDLCGKIVVDSCRKHSIVVPKEVAVLGVDDDDIFCELSHPSLSSIALTTEKAGYEAAALLDKMIKGEEPDTKKILVEPVDIKERQSTNIIAVNDKLVLDILNYIQDNAHKPLQVQDIVDEFSVSRRFLYNKFNDVLGTTLYGEIRRARVEKICKMLIGTNLSIKEIAFKLEFSDCDHVSRFFKKEKGVSPSQFRAQYL